MYTILKSVQNVPNLKPVVFKIAKPGQAHTTQFLSGDCCRCLCLPNGNRLTKIWSWAPDFTNL